MYLDRIDIDQHGPLSRIALGPFAAGLNAVIASAGAGKSALVRFLRDSLTGTTPSRDGLTHSQGTVAWAAADGIYHCRREPNGTTHGHRSVTFQSKIGVASPHQLRRNISVVFDLPMCVVDGIVTDTKQSRVQHCVNSVIQSGLDSLSHTDRSYESEIAQLRREIATLEQQIESYQLHARHASAVGSQAYQSYGLTADMHQLRARRAALANEIATIDARREWTNKSATEQARKARKRKLFASITKDIQRLRDEQSQLTLKLEDVEAKLEQNQQADAQSVNRAAIAKAYRNRLQLVESQLDQLRTVAGEIRSLGRLWFGDRSLPVQQDALSATHPAWIQLPSDASYDASNERFEAEIRADLQLESNYWNATGYDTIAEAPVSDLAYRAEQRIDAICRIVDQMVGQCDSFTQTSVHPLVDRFESLADSANAGNRSIEADSAVLSDSLTGSNHADPADEGEWFQIHSGLDHAERLLAEERKHQAHLPVQQPGSPTSFASTLNGISQRLRGLMGRHAAFGSRNVDPRFHNADAYSITHPVNEQAELDPHARLAALARCEQEVVRLLRDAMSRRQVIIQRISEALQVPTSQVVASYTDQQLEHDDPRLYQQLVRDRIVTSEFEAKQRVAAGKRLVSERDALRGKLNRITTLITDRVAEAETIRLYLRQQPVVKADQADETLRQRLVAEMDAIDSLLRRPQIDRGLLERHAHAVARLTELQSATHPRSGIAAAASAILSRLSSGVLQQVRWQLKNHGEGAAAVQLDGQNEMARSVHDRELASIAVRLAAADELARRGRELPVIIELSAGVTNSGRSPYSLQTMVDVLNEAVRRGRQIVVLTDNPALTQTIQRAGGLIHSLSGNQTGHSPRSHYSAQSFLTTIKQPIRHEAQLFDVNSDFDLAWREAQGDESVWRFEERSSEPVIAPERKSTAEPKQSSHTQVVSTSVTSSGPDPQLDRVVQNSAAQLNGRAEAAAVPFSLSGSSSLDVAPNIDSAVAVRLKAIGIESIDQLLAQSPKELAARLNSPELDAAVIRRLQSECRLLIGVRHLTPYPAKVLVGCGITHPRELSETDFAILAERIEAFLATDRGRSLAKSASALERSRLQDWIQNHRSRQQPRRERTSEPKKSSTSRFSDLRRQTLRGETKARDVQPKQRESVKPAVKSDSSSSTKMRFYLQRSDDVEAAPSIGPRMAERLHKVGVRMVSDLLGRSPESIASALQHSKITADVVKQWQQQATLVCRVPLLRGHDAQLLVAAGITTPERLAQCESGWLLGKVEPIANSAEGKAILRGGKLPDLAEVQSWIDCSQHKRDLVAA